MESVTSIAIRVAVAALPAAGKKILSKVQQRKIADGAASVLVANTADPFVQHLNAPQLERLEQFVHSPQFGHLMLQTMLCATAGYKEEDTSYIRDQLRAGLKLGGIFAEGDLVQATDVLHELLHSSVHAVRSSAPGVLNHQYAMAMAAQIATAGARNTKLLQRVETLNEFNKFATKLRTQTRALHSKLRLPTVVQARTVDYSQLYVTPTLHDSVDNIQLDLETVLAQRLRTIILGDPGAGKSTLVSKLAHDFADDKIAACKGQVPLLLVVRDHTANLRVEHQTLVHYLEAACRKPYGVSPPPDSLEYLLLNGLATVVIDGVDELGDSHFRASFAQMVEAFAHLYPLTRIIVTSRVIGYHDAPLDDGLFSMTSVAPFNERQVKRYAQRWYRLDGSMPRSDQDALCESFLQDSTEAADLRANPLMLSLLCALYSSERFIPRNRPGVYEKCAELLFETWDRSRGIEVTHHFRSFVKPSVQELAWHLFTDPAGRQALPKSEMASFLAKSVLANKFDSEEEASRAADDFLRFCAGRAWVLTDTGSDKLQPHYGFAHKTFLEYFAAAQLVRQEPDPTVVWGKIRTHLDDGTWDVVSQLAIQILDGDRSDGADSLLRLVLAEVEQRHGGGYPEKTIALLHFAARCLDTVAPNNATLRLLALCATALSCNVPVQDRRGFELDVNSKKLIRGVDAPLTALLSVRAPENTTRVARAIVDAIEKLSYTQSERSSAGLIYEILKMDGALVHAAPVAAQISSTLQAKPMPTTAKTWHRLLQSPTPQDVEQRGIALLYETSSVCLTSIGCYAQMVLESTVLQYTPEPTRTTFERVLEELYDVSAEYAVRSLPGLRQQDWQHVVDSASSVAIEQLSVTARATALLLLMPILRYEWAADMRDDRMRWLATVGVEPSRRQAAVETINRWKLPMKAHHKLIEWAQR